MLSALPAEIAAEEPEEDDQGGYERDVDEIGRASCRERVYSGV